MSPRVRPISNLYYRYGKTLGLEGSAVAQALLDAGIIQMVGLDHYSEVETLKNLESTEFEKLVSNAIEKYLLKMLVETETPVIKGKTK